MKTILSTLILLGLTFGNPAFAQTEPDPTAPETPVLEPAITAEATFPLGKTALFDAGESVVADDAPAMYRWDFTDTRSPDFGTEVLHKFESIGVHRVTLTITQGNASASVSREVQVYDKKVLLVTDQSLATSLDRITEQAADSGVLLKTIVVQREETGFLTEEKLVPIIGEDYDFIDQADTLIFFTDASVGLQAFTRYWQSLDTEKRIALHDKLIVAVTDSNLALTSQLAEQSFQVMRPRYVLVTRPEAINPIFTANVNTVIEELDSRAIEKRVIDSSNEKSRFFFLSHAITSFITQGIPTNTIYLILAFPFITFFVTFVRQVIGLSTFGVYTPTVIALSLMILGIYFGLGALLIVVTVSYLLRVFLSRFKLLYLPRTSLILSAIGLSFLVVIWLLSNYQLSLAASLAIFPMLVMSTLSEKFLSAQSEEGLGGALWGVVKTVTVAVAAYYLVVWSAFTNLVMSWPELIIIPLALLILLGKFTGLRLTEYMRFRSLFKEKDVEE